MESHHITDCHVWGFKLMYCKATVQLTISSVVTCCIMMKSYIYYRDTFSEPAATLYVLRHEKEFSSQCRDINC